jgi:tRNA wybutosine-synthesizing protein 3
MPSSLPTSISSTFAEKKRKILSQLSTPEEEYSDLSPKGSVDAGIRSFVDEINALEGFVTTSSCAGRVSVFLDGSGKKVTGSTDATRSENLEAGVEDDNANGDRKEDDAERDGENMPANLESASTSGGGKGGGSWLFVSHDPVDMTLLKSDDDVLALCGFGKDQQISFPPPDDPRPRFVHFRFEPMVSLLLP